MIQAIALVRTKRPHSLRAFGPYIVVLSILILSGSARAIGIGLYLLDAQRTDSAGASKDDQDVRTLEKNQPIEREIAGGQSHLYRITLGTGQYLRAVVNQKGIDLKVILFGPGNKKITEVDSPNGTRGLEVMSVIVESAGVYRLEVLPSEKTATAGRYEVKVQVIRDATSEDKSRIAAQLLFAEAEQLGKGVAESKRKSIEKYTEAAALFRSAGDLAEETHAINNIGIVYFMLGEMPKALEYYDKALSLRRARGDRNAEAQSLNNIGMVYWSSGELKKALDYFNESLPLRRTAGDRAGQATTLNNIGLVYDSLGDKLKALDYFNQSLPLRRGAGDREAEATTLNNIGMAYWALGEMQKALDYLNEALLISKRFNDRRMQANTLQNIGTVYLDLGDKQKALDYYKQALPLRKAAGDPRGEATTLNNIGAVYRILGDRQKALDYHNQALAITKETNHPSGQASVLYNICVLYYDAGEQQKALDCFNQTLQLSGGTVSRAGQAGVLHSIGTVYRSLGEWQKALEYYNEALSLKRATHDRRGEAISLLGIARVEQKRGNLTRARPIIEEAISIIESLRTSVSGQELRASYFESVHSYYESYIDLLMQLHKQDSSAELNAIALGASERRRARSLLELLAEARADIRQGIDKTLLERERYLQQLLNTKSNRQIRLLSGKHTQEQAQEAADEISGLITELQQVQARIRATSPRYAALTQPVPLNLREIQQQLDPDVLLLEYALGSERGFLWAVTQTTMTSFELPERAKIESTANTFHNLLTARNLHVENETPRERRKRLTEADSEYAKAASELSRILLGPVAGQLGSRRLLIVADGALQYVPFAALPPPDSQGKSGPLILEHEIVNLPSASAIAVLRREIAGRKNAPHSVAVLADPVFDKYDSRVNRKSAPTSSSAKDVRADQRANTGDAAEVPAEVSDELMAALKGARVINATGRIQRLPFTREEATFLYSLIPESDRKVALDFEASRATVMSGELAQYRIVHFATHGLLDSQHPELSAIVLSLVDRDGMPQNGFLRLNDIYNLNLPIELAILSACQTGLGREIKGEGLVGLTRGFMYSGAARVMASLWKVDDKATAELMKHFYQAMLGKDRLPAAAALRAAQSAMWKQKRWQDPYYWAGFVLQGEWR